jgi:mRNA interferase HigB
MKVITDFAARHADARTPLYAWVAEAKNAEWRGPQDVKARYPSASILSADRVIFNIKGNRYRMLTRIDYPNQLILVKAVGTHAEYSSWQL